jgi:acetyl/propionyl-CoA carboxylase alpha subunit
VCLDHLMVCHQEIRTDAVVRFHTFAFTVRVRPYRYSQIAQESRGKRKTYQLPGHQTNEAVGREGKHADGEVDDLQQQHLLHTPHQAVCIRFQQNRQRQPQRHADQTENTHYRPMRGQQGGHHCQRGDTVVSSSTLMVSEARQMHRIMLPPTKTLQIERTKKERTKKPKTRKQTDPLRPPSKLSEHQPPNMPPTPPPNSKRAMHLPASYL